MPVYRLPDEPLFPPVDEAEEGLLAVGGDLSVERLIVAYSSGIFPWYSDGEPIMWHAPDPRCVLTTESLRVTRRLRRTLDSNRYRITLDRRFDDVIEACAATPREGQSGTWITDEMIAAYCELHELGLAHSVDVWAGDDLVGGLYGVSLGAVFFGESMFSHARDASKVAMVRLMEQLARWEMPLLDCQVENDHLLSMGAELWPRRRFMEALGELLVLPVRRGKWEFDS